MYVGRASPSVSLPHLVGTFVCKNPIPIQRLEKIVGTVSVVYRTVSRSNHPARALIFYPFPFHRLAVIVLTLLQYLYCEDLDALDDEGPAITYHIIQKLLPFCARGGYR